MHKSYILLSLLICFTLSSTAETITWNSQNNFGNRIYKSVNTEFIKSGTTPLYYKIKKNSAFDGNETDLYLPFDKGGANIDGNYKYIYSKFQYRESNPYINTAGFFFKDDQRIELEGNQRTVFTPGKIIGSFSISFQIYPLTFSADESIFSIGAHYYNEKNDSVEDQSISCLLDEGILRVRFNNVFSLKNVKLKPFVEMRSYQRIEAGEWTGVTLAYDAYTGLARILINGRESGILMLTEDGTPDSSILNISFNEKNRCLLNIASDYTGAIDEFIIKRNNSNEVGDQYSANGGEIVSHVIKLEEFPVVMRSGVFDHSAGEANSVVKYYIRYSNEPFYPDENVEVLKQTPWVEFSTNAIAGKAAKYIQWKALLLPGGGGKISPKFKGVSLVYDRNLPPAKPLGVQAIAVHGAIRIKWHMNSESDLKGYKVYYGTRSGEYFCSDAAQGDSPYKIGKMDTVDITGLKNNLVYYISITAYDDVNGTHESEFSDEISLRYEE